MASGSRLPSTIHHHHHLSPIDSSSFYLTGDPTTFQGSSSMFSFEDVNDRNNSCKNKRTFFQSFEQEDIAGDDQDYGEYFNQSGKKRRLSLDQLNFLEKSFEMDNKLEPDRKLHLANDLGLQPRQVAIWFQNRRARWKTKQIEMDYDVLQQSFDSLKASYDNLCHEKEHLKSQIALLSEECAQKQIAKCTTGTPNEESKQEEYSTSPAKINNGIFDSYSTSTKKDDTFETDTHYNINVSSNMHSPHLEHVDSSYMLEHDNSDLSQDEDDRACFSPSTPYGLRPKLEPVDYSLDDLTSGNFSFPAFWSWSF